ncbi:YfjI family protein [Pseudomonas citronellolis]|uniref:YfjI family protein n=1 Tax=Pseudomonas citronellolis TaxID=53408 RepID=UPI00389A626F
MKNSVNEYPLSVDPYPLKFDDGWPCFREHSLFEAAVIEAARELQVSREMAMMCAFGAMAAACQGHVDVLMPTGHKALPTSLMLLTIADSGERKTTTQNYFFQAINALNDAAHRDHETALQEQQFMHKLWRAHLRHLEREYTSCLRREDVVKARTAFEELDAFVRIEPQPPRSGKFLYEDTTPQALVQMLYENTPNACLVTSEANSIFSGKALGELDKLNTLWDGSNVIVDRISREGFILQNARLTLALMAQPSVIARFMSKRGEEARGTGFLARFLIVRPRPMAGYRDGAPQTERPRKQAFNTRIAERLASTDTTGRQVLRFSEPAAKLWFEYNQYLEQQMRENGLYHYARDHASKLLENVSRLAAIVHAFERNSDSDTEIDAFTLKFCWEFACLCSGHFIKYLANEPQVVTDANLLAQFLLDLAEKDPRNDRLLEIKEGKKEGTYGYRFGLIVNFKPSKVTQRGPNSLRRPANRERLEAAFDLLTKLGHLKKEGSYYSFSETIHPNVGEPSLRNGEVVTIKELPLFKEYERVQERGTKPRYVIKTS